jgi:N utilization substance protein B
MKAPSQNPRTFAREYALQFLYQCESEKIFYFDEARFSAFAEHFAVREDVIALTRDLVVGVLGRLGEIDQHLTFSSENWKLTRMSAIDRNVMRIALYELIGTTAPTKVILNEAIELAKTYGSENSGRFVNGLLDGLAKTIRAGKAIGV